MASPETVASTDEFIKGLWRENPVFVQVLGMCPVLAVTNSGINALSMGLATTFVIVLSNTLVSTLRNFIPKEVRIATFILIIATFVTVVDYLIQAISLEIHRALGAFISLIVVNCLILGRAEAFASKNGVGPSDEKTVFAPGNLGFPVFPAGFQPWVVMILPSGGFFTLGVLLLVFNRIKSRQDQKATPLREVTS